MPKSDHSPEPPPFGEYGRLTYDEIEDGLLCHECGGWYRNLATHARLSHQISAEDYREKHGLNRSAKLVTPTVRERLRQAALPYVPEKLARGHLQPFDRYPDKFREVLELAAEVSHEGPRPEGIRHRKESWNDERREQMRARTAERALTGSFQPTPRQIREGIRRTGGEARCERCNVAYRRENKRFRFCPSCRLEIRREADRARDRRKKAEPDRARSAEAGEADILVGCRRCGRQFRTPAQAHHAMYCPECHPEVMRDYQRDYKRQRNERRERKRLGLPDQPREITCARCRQPFVAPAKNSRLCQSCQRETNREYLREYYRRRKAARGAVIEDQTES